MDEHTDVQTNGQVENVMPSPGRYAKALNRHRQCVYPSVCHILNYTYIHLHKVVSQ